MQRPNYAPPLGRLCNLFLTFSCLCFIVVLVIPFIWSDRPYLDPIFIMVHSPIGRYLVRSSIQLVSMECPLSDPVSYISQIFPKISWSINLLWKYFHLYFFFSPNIHPVQRKTWDDMGDSLKKYLPIIEPSFFELRVGFAFAWKSHPPLTPLSCNLFFFSDPCKALACRRHSLSILAPRPHCNTAAHSNSRLSTVTHSHGWQCRLWFLTIRTPIPFLRFLFGNT